MHRLRVVTCMSHDYLNSTTTNEDERYFENPTYEDTSSRLNLTSGSVSDEAPKNGNISVAVYSTISQNGEDGSTYDVLTRAQATGIQMQPLAQYCHMQNTERLRKSCMHNYRIIPIATCVCIK